MGLTVSRKTAKNLAVRRKNERIILTVSRKKMLTAKRSNHKIRSRVLLLSLRPCPHVSGNFFFSQIFFCGCENFRVHTQRIRIVFSRPRVSDCIRKFSDLL